MRPERARTAPAAKRGPPLPLNSARRGVLTYPADRPSLARRRLDGHHAARALPRPIAPEFAKGGQDRERYPIIGPGADSGTVEVLGRSPCPTCVPSARTRASYWRRPVSREGISPVPGYPPAPQLDDAAPWPDEPAEPADDADDGDQPQDWPWPPEPGGGEAGSG
jgi:hypothetical protein